jgi:ammonia channel protein AmtB
MDLMYFRKPSVIGAIQGMITGLVAITPAAGFVAGKQLLMLLLSRVIVVNEACLNSFPCQFQLAVEGDHHHRTVY